ncbi:hypothetical protein DFH08DRAFT_850932 [Mycena albidolilacea]|uniref:Uncharacterized protein n=1 Tax=Mycena albidolilacea TaxID=1033008 RepID=A0AAD7AFJ6_9AGAR|nr:hypothetical protein DFH08DRAFT_850932 [Mycena albidolilacea]
MPIMHPPYYVLASASAALVHPTIQYHYKDDPPLDLLPQPGEQVLVLDYDPETSAPPTIQSISPSISVTGLRVEEAPGAAAAAVDEGVARNDRMFIIETTTAQDRPMDSSMTERKPPQTVLAQFKQRNALLRRSLDYPISPSQA